MKNIGTIWCKLFGHKFLAETIDYTDLFRTRWNVEVTRFCVRCGILKEDL